MNKTFLKVVWQQYNHSASFKKVVFGWFSCRYSLRGKVSCKAKDKESGATVAQEQKSNVARVRKREWEKDWAPYTAGSQKQRQLMPTRHLFVGLCCLYFTSHSWNIPDASVAFLSPETDRYTVTDGWTGCRLTATLCLSLFPMSPNSYLVKVSDWVFAEKHMCTNV